MPRPAPDKTRAPAEELTAHHTARPHATVAIGTAPTMPTATSTPRAPCCGTTKPCGRRLHLKNTDARSAASYGFGGAERQRGSVDIPALCRLLLASADLPPTCDLVGCLETPGPQPGRDSMDGRLEPPLRESPRYLEAVYQKDPL
jgi:hypothetical protein